jgi:hypothetical protein
LQIGKGQNEVRLEIQDFWNVGGDEGGDARLLAPDLWRPYRVAGNADDPILFAEQKKGLDGFLGETDDTAGRELAHKIGMQNKTWLVTIGVS